jgi:diguanylate cyclase (GGDEF)-like protein
MLLGFLNASVLLLLFVWCASLGKRQRRLDAISLYDPMTGLLSGRVFTCERWPAAIRGAAPVAVLYIDLDELKKKNNQDGHDAGDAYIINAARHLQRRRGIDQVFRLNGAGDEFAVLLLGPDALNAQPFANALLRDLGAAGISASIGGVVTVSVSHSRRASVLPRAEAAMRTAKLERGRVIFETLAADA